MLRRLAGAVAMGFGMIFAPRTHEQHWSEPVTVLVEEDRDESESSDA